MKEEIPYLPHLLLMSAPAIFASADPGFADPT